MGYNLQIDTETTRNIQQDKTALKNKKVTITMASSLSELLRLQERYPFSTEELEILVRCHEQIENSTADDDTSYLLKLATASPFAYYFLPGDEMKERLTWIENNILPMGFPSQLRAAISSDSFVAYANAGQDKSLERFLEGIADTGRRGPREALGILYNCAPDMPSSEELMDLCLRLALACDAFKAHSLDKNAYLKRVEALEASVLPLAKSLSSFCKDETNGVEKKIFINWAETTFPLFASPISTFIHHLVFHRMPFPDNRLPYAHARLMETSDIFYSKQAEVSLLLPLSLATRYFSGGKMKKLYSSETDGRSFNRLEWSVAGYEGPTLLAIKTEAGAVLGAFTETPWKESVNYYGTGNCFLFQLSPDFQICWPSGKEEHFMYMHSSELKSPLSPPFDGLPHGIGFGGSVLTKPRLFIPDSLERCSADYMDRSYECGDLLPLSSLGTFEIGVLEVWGVGTVEGIEHALKKQVEYRAKAEEAISRARVVTDKSQFVKDLESGLIHSHLYQHREDARGRHDFRVDESHGGYKVDRE